MVAQSYANNDYGIDWSQLDSLQESAKPELSPQEKSKLDKGVPQDQKIMDKLKSDVSSFQEANPETKNENYEEKELSPEDKTFLQNEGLVGKENAELQHSDDIADYIFKKLEGLGYPPRRLESFKQDFLEQKLFAGGTKEVKVTIPDRYYGTNKRLSDADYTGMVHEIENKFKLQFTEGERGKDKKIVINFISQQNPEKQADQVESAPDILDEVYGSGKKDKKKQEKTASQSDVLKDLFKKGTK